MRTVHTDLGQAIDACSRGTMYNIRQLQADADYPNITHLHVTRADTGHSLGIITTVTDTQGALAFHAMTTGIA